MTVEHRKYQTGIIIVGVLIESHYLLFCQIVTKLYDESANLVWDGNAVVGKDGIAKFHESLPMSVHTVDCIDAQPVAGQYKYSAWNRHKSFHVP